MFPKPKPSSLDSDGTTPEKRFTSELSPFHFHDKGKQVVNGKPRMSPFPNATMEPSKTPAERSRELSLLSDPMAHVLGPYHVECLQCKKKIKLSSKSAFDTFHWRNHRTRCTRIFKKVNSKKPKASKITTQSPPASSSSTIPLKLTTSSLSLLPTRSSQTPPLMLDNDEDRHSERSSEVHSPAMTSHSIPGQSTPPVHHWDPINEYIIRSHPGYVHRSAASPPSGSWQNWSWSQLKPPQFSTTYDDEDNDMENDDISEESSTILEDVEDVRVREAARTLSMLSRSR